MDSALDDCFSDEVDDVEDAFNQAAEHLTKITSKLSSDLLLEFYGLYKQSTNGSCNTPKPGFFNAQAKLKWNAWKKLGDLERENAMRLYVEKLKEVSPDWKEKSDKKDKHLQWVSVSTHQPEPDDDVPENSKTIFDHVKQNNFVEFKKFFKTLPNLNEFDESGLALIHWATDRNAIEILEYLLDKGAEVNFKDSEGQTALHYASSCGHIECIKILLKFGADPFISDNDGANCLDVSFDAEVKNLISKT